ncbi:WhiB family transcriptional regulator [Amycolatopsis saalfeldensis]|uniref:Transcriptional regulator WhiB n=1 Tax=Amycolatopsis saalfeldensis TaxID=394193 RepID=A0A1H8YPH0_9PSEU|nr:WhiB family transcriptional regulator [Amycolatopsis saalfeldensis]SEP53983.1 Transcription factor WhiB [Amycolatopsis saalfeldensis]
MRGPTALHHDLLTSVAEYAGADWRWLQLEVENSPNRACREMDIQEFFPADGARFFGQALQNERDRVAALCHSCPVRRECLAGALLRGETYGSWGGVAQPDYQILQRMWREQALSRKGAA